MAILVLTSLTEAVSGSTGMLLLPNRDVDSRIGFPIDVRSEEGSEISRSIWADNVIKCSSSKLADFRNAYFDFREDSILQNNQIFKDYSLIIQTL